MYKKIMVAVDGSETAKQALAEAENIANSYNATLCIVHSIVSDTEADKKRGVDLLEQASSSVDALNLETRLLEAEVEYGLNGILADVAPTILKLMGMEIPTDMTGKATAAMDGRHGRLSSIVWR